MENKIKEIIKKWEGVIHIHPKRGLYGIEVLQEMLSDLKAIQHFPKEEENKEEVRYWECASNGNDFFVKGKIYPVIDKDNGLVEIRNENQYPVCIRYEILVEKFKWVTKEAYDLQEGKKYKVEEIGEIGGTKYKNAVKYDFVCPHSGEVFMEGESSYFAFVEKIDLNPLLCTIGEAQIKGVYRNCFAYFHTKESALEWNRKKFGAKEEPKGIDLKKCAENLDKSLNNETTETLTLFILQKRIESLVNLVQELENKLNNICKCQ